MNLRKAPAVMILISFFYLWVFPVRLEALSLIRLHPLAFLGFMFLGGGFLIVGITIYLYSLVSVAAPPKA